MNAAFRFGPLEMPAQCAALRGEVREFIAGELAAGLWIPNSDFVSHRLARFAGSWGRVAGSA
jgi:hypothetical protein